MTQMTATVRSNAETAAQANTLSGSAGDARHAAARCYQWMTLLPRPAPPKSIFHAIQRRSSAPAEIVRTPRRC